MHIGVHVSFSTLVFFRECALACSKGDTDILDTVGEGEGGKIRKNSTETYTLPRVKQTASGSSMYDVGTQSRRSVATRRMGWAGGGGVQEGGTHTHTPNADPR